MYQFIKEVKDIPGILGACLYSSRDGIQESTLPGIFKPETLSALGSQLALLYTHGQKCFDALTDVTLNYDEFVVIGRGLSADQLIVVVCELSFNQKLLTMAFNLLEKDSVGGIHVSDENGIRERNPSAAASSPGGAESRAEDLTGLFASLKEMLVKVIGPMAGFVFDEAFDEWQKQGAASISRIDQLRAGIERLIADPEKSAHYRSLIKPSLTAYTGRR